MQKDAWARLEPATAGWAALAIAMLALTGCLVESEELDTALRTSEERVVYGDDDRMDVYAHPSAFWRDVARSSIVALVPERSIRFDERGELVIPTRTLGQARSLCEGQRFRDQPTLANCSGTLIGRDLVLTAGHCVETLNECRGTRFVFDYFYADEGRLESITAEDVYGCSELVTQRLDNASDYAIVRLDRPVTPDRRAMPVRREGEAVERGQPVTIIGFGSGLPAKIDTGGVVQSPDATRLQAFRATVDAFGGNSGSGVFTEDGRVVGVLVRGATDYVRQGSCNVVSTLPATSSQSTFGEDVQYAFRAFDAACAVEGFRAGFCDGHEDPCAACDEEGACEGGATCHASADGLSLCLGACAGDSECPAGFTCEGALCVPTRVEGCLGNARVETDYCGRVANDPVPCDLGTLCAAGTCVPEGVGNSCATAEVLAPVTGVTRGTLDASYTNTSTGSCAGAGRERVWSLTFDQDVRFSAISTGFDTVLYLRRDCDDGGTEVFCNDDSNPPGQRGSRIRGDLTAGTYHLFLDAYGAQSGAFELSLTVDPICSCALGELSCDGRDVVSCEAVEGEACPQLVEWEACAEDEICAGGACRPAEEGDRCEDAPELGPGRTDVGRAIWLEDTFAASCAADRPERFYRLVIDETSDVSIVPTASATRIALLGDCGTEELQCAPRIDTRLQPGIYHVAIEVPAQGLVRVDTTIDPACDDACAGAGAQRCVGDGGQARCVLDEVTGCLVEAIDPDYCDTDAGWVCVEGGVMTACTREAEPDDDAGADGGTSEEDTGGIVTADAGSRASSQGGCATTSGHAAGGLWIVLGLALARRRRR